MQQVLTSTKREHNVIRLDLTSPGRDVLRMGHAKAATQAVVGSDRRNNEGSMSSAIGAGGKGAEELRAAWAAGYVAPLWENRAAHGNRPAPEAAHIWRWSQMQPLIEAAISVRSMEAVERRVLSLIGPQTAEIGGARGTTTNLNAGLQILMPGETARPHRHSMNALRFVLSGEGATTIVDGKACPMAEGDLVTTPGWCWHEHVHRGEKPIVWLDVLDASLHRYLGTDAFQPGPANELPLLTPDAAYTSSCLVPETADRRADYSPVFRYPWHEASRAVASAPVGADGTRKVRYANPLDGGPVMAFLDCWVVELAAGSVSMPCRSTANAVCTVIEGSGRSEVGGMRFDWGPKDVMSLPHSNWVQHWAGTERVRLFIVSDRPVLARLGLLKEEIGQGT